MKIYIIGAAGSGKTTLTQKISEITNIQSTNLDNLFWNNDSKSYGITRNIIERNNIFSNIINNESWIIEGAYVEWPIEGLYKSDQIIYLNIKKSIIIRRIAIRFIKGQLNIIKSNKKETLFGMIRLLNWNMKQITKIGELMKEIKKQKREIVELHNVCEVSQYLKNV
jgi:adenylate kinase family enzyme